MRDLQMTTKRKDVSKKDCWNVEAIYSTYEDWEKAYQKLVPNEKRPRWPELSQFRGKLGDEPEVVKNALETILGIDRKLELVYTYAHLKHDEDIAENKNKIAYSKAYALLHDFAEEISWFEPELLALSDEKIQQYLNDSSLKDYRFHLEKILRMKKHTLSAEKESLLSQAGQALSATHKAFSAINDADFKFGTALDEKGNAHEITHAQYGMYIREQDRVLRKNAFEKYHGKYHEYANTLCELLNGNIQSHLFYARAKNYNSCLEAALYPKNIDLDVYHALIKAVDESMAIHHKYISLRKKVLGVDTLHLYDVYVPLTANVDIKMPYNEAEEVIIESVKPLGTEYQNLLKNGLINDRWVDRYENENKRSGGYSSGCYDSMPYILMNYKGIIRDVFTLAHEIGHSMHSLLTHKYQPYQYGNYPIFLAEVASTLNEDLLMRYLLEKTTDVQEKIFLINQKIEDIRATLFRQTMFAEFELMIHTAVEQNTPLTPAMLNEAYTKLNKKYFGEEMTIDPTIAIEWGRIPHFYYNFYVYQYATGISAALALSERVANGGTKERDAYLSFLKGGSSKYPIELLKQAGVDMRSPEPVKAAIKKFGDLVDQLEVLIQEKNLALNTKKC
jgi:oligoendopeptidase F